MKALVLDFDGVISDSAPEAFRVALRTYRDLRPQAAMPADEESLYADFLSAMPLGNRAEDYGVTLAAFEARLPLPDQAAYDRFYRAQDPSWLARFHERFYRVRADLARTRPEAWRAWMSPYPELLAILRRRAGEARLAIATAKDRVSVRDLLAGYGVADLFPDELVLDKEAGRSKRAHLERLRGELGCGFEELTFVDDKVSHLDSAAPLGVRCVLAAWGYNGPREHALARERGYLVCTLGDFEARLFA